VEMAQIELIFLRRVLKNFLRAPRAYAPGAETLRGGPVFAAPGRGVGCRSSL
jgi:hypothetical protein